MTCDRAPSRAAAICIPTRAPVICVPGCAHKQAVSARRTQRGFALLFILLIAAGIAIAMYAELPRVAFETQRNREELLVERGEQYQRAIGLFVKKFQRYPAKLEDLENTNNLRFLRRRYADPMTGKAEWRFIKVGPGGILLDSLVKKNPLQGQQGQGQGKDAKDMTAPGGSMNVNPGFAGTGGDPSATGQPGGPTEVNPAVARRASDRPLVGNPGAAPPGQFGQFPTGDPNSQNAPPPPQFVQQYPGQQGQQPVPGQDPYGNQQPQQPGNPNLQQGQPGFGQAGQPGMGPAYPNAPLGQNPMGGQQQPFPGQGQQAPGQLGQPPSFVPGQPGQVWRPGQAVPGQPGMPQPFNPNPLGTPPPQVQQPPQPGFNQPQPGFNQPGSFNQQGQQGSFNQQGQQGSFNQQGQQGSFNQGGSTFNQGGSFNNQGNAGTQMVNQMLTNPQVGVGGMNAGMGGNVAGGIGGVASKYKGPSIKIYNEQQRYEKWEFVYDPKKDPALNKNMPAQQKVDNPGNRVGTSTSSGSSFGSGGTSNNGSSFNNGPSQ